MTVGDDSRTAVAEIDSNQDRLALLAAVDHGNLDRVRNAARRLLNRAVSATRAAKLVRAAIEKNPPAGLKPFRIALLSSFSIELLEDSLVAHAYTEGLALNVYKPGFDQYQQQILNPAAGLYEFDPDLIILVVDGSRWVPELYGSFLDDRGQLSSLVDATALKVSSLLGELRRLTTAPVLLHSLPYPRYPALGVLDATHEAGQRGLIARINEKLAEMSREMGAIYLVDVDAIIQSVGHDGWYDPRLELYARSPIGRSAMDTLARVYLRYVRSISGFTRKCVVVDLDDSLWGGILGELGPRGVALGSDYPGNAYIALQRALLGLRHRGVLLAIASKNDERDVDQVFAENPAMVLKREHFSARQIHWGPKSRSIAAIAEYLNLDVRHFVFVDDNPAECAEVELAHPSITTIELPAQPERFVHALLGEGLFDSLSFSAEDTGRAVLYERRAAAERLRVDSPSLEDFYRSLEMRSDLERVNPHNVSRAAQMTQKITQFNATTRRYTEADLTVRMKSKNWAMLAMRVVDRFGDNGIVGLLLAERCGDSYAIDTLLMSCRVINRGAETCMLHWLAAKATAEGVPALEGWIFPTARNAPVREVYQRLGFAAVESTDQGTKWRLDLTTNTVDAPSWIGIVDETAP